MFDYRGLNTVIKDIIYHNVSQKAKQNYPYRSPNFENLDDSSVVSFCMSLIEMTCSGVF